MAPFNEPYSCSGHAPFVLSLCNTSPCHINVGSAFSLDVSTRSLVRIGVSALYSAFKTPRSCLAFLLFLSLYLFLFLSLFCACVSLLFFLSLFCFIVVSLIHSQRENRVGALLTAVCVLPRRVTTCCHLSSLPLTRRPILSAS